MTYLFSSLAGLELVQLIGVMGFMLYVATYCALSFYLLSSESVWYFALNTTAATLVLISLTADFNLASALIQGFWIAIGIGAITVRVMRHRMQKRAARKARKARLLGGPRIDQPVSFAVGAPHIAPPAEPVFHSGRRAQLRVH